MRQTRQPKHALVTLAAILAALPALALEAPRPVSPAVAGGVATVSTGCPSFSWTSADGAEGYELLVYRLEAGEPAGNPVVREALPAGASSWTPTAERCLEAGAAYGWVVRSVGGGAGGAWSKPALFEVALPSRAEVTAALETLRRYLEGEPELQGAVPPSLPGPSEEAHQRLEVLETDGVAAVVTPLEMRLLEERLALVEPKGHSSGSAAIHAVEPSTSGPSYGVWGQSGSTQGRGVLGFTSATSGATVGVWGESRSTQGAGVLGRNFATSGFTYGVWGESSSTEGIGVVGWTSTTSGATVGVWGESSSVQGRGVLGVNSATSGFNFGVWGQSGSTQGTGVVGWTSATSGFTRGVWAQSSSTQGTGVFGVADATSGATRGVVGESSSTLGTGVFGTNFATSGTTRGVVGQISSTQGTAVLGAATAGSGTNYGVYGSTNSAQGYAGYFLGRVEVEGSFSVSGSKNFKIDHPLDPENQYLYHFALESDEVLNFYNGNVVLDASGEAWIELPEWFAAINQDFRYQLTAIGLPGPNLHVAQKIEGNRFKIGGGLPAMEVSWTVTAQRADPWVRDHAPRVEVEKAEEERGRYLYPAGYGQPEERGLHWEMHEQNRRASEETPAPEVALGLDPEGEPLDEG